MKIIAFYLPQFHPIPENDAWWGSGFTEWTNVASAKPLFRGHYQPQLPADLGFYDLRLDDIRQKQADLAFEYGVSAFCYYHYWFNGKPLLELPLERLLKSSAPDFPFCVCWANETWSRRWDGQDDQILIGQDYLQYNVERHFGYLESAFKDPRYLKVDDKPIFIIYRIDQIPNIEETIIEWRAQAQKIGLKGIYICAVKSHMHQLDDKETIGLGFDALLDFQPTKSILKKRKLFNHLGNFLPRCINFLIRKTKSFSGLTELNTINIYDYSAVVDAAIKMPKSQVIKFPCIFPSWDNTPRRKKKGASVIQNEKISDYKRWLADALHRVKGYPEQERIVFINAWNEWAEGCHLEPDLKNKKKFLEATKEAMGNADVR